MARKDTSMTGEETRAFLEEGRTLQVATIGRDGVPHLAPMWYVIDDGTVVFRSYSKSQKIVNLRRDPRLTVLVEAGAAYGELRGVMITGTAELVDDPGYVLTLYGKIAERYPLMGGQPAGLDPEALRAAFGRLAAKNTAVLVHPARVITWDHTRLAGSY